MGLVQKHLVSEGVPKSRIASISLEDRDCGVRTADDLYAWLKAYAWDKEQSYLFIDEVQRISGWHGVVNSARKRPDNLNEAEKIMRKHFP